MRTQWLYGVLGFALLVPLDFFVCARPPSRCKRGAHCAAKTCSAAVGIGVDLRGGLPRAALPEKAITFLRAGHRPI